VSPTTAEHVWEELGERVDLILDGGACEVGLESTIVDLSGDPPTLLRPGAITPAMLVTVLGRPLGDPAQNVTRTSGRLESHYAPRAAVELVAAEEVPAKASQWALLGSKVVVLAPSCPLQQAGVGFLPLSAEPEAFARGLYAALREADAWEADVALVVPPPETGLGLAIADRLRKAAAPRGA
jgi:L-threonylcarbamoyladenylate synthase